jgi:3-dehydroquinate synthase
MPRVTVGLEARSYDVVIENGALVQAEQLLGVRLGKNRPVIVTDEHVATAQLPTLLAALSCQPHVITLPAGEATKSWAQLAQLCDALIELGVERSDHIIALGGGVIGDLVGFAAAIIKRGCNFIQIPTTLLAQVDSSVGGKTAINTAAGKNLVGSFHQPSLVLIDPEVLDTLPPRDVRAGYAEVMKYGLINDAAFFEWCEKNGDKLIAGDSAARLHAIETSVRAKAAIVAADEREMQDVRALLNLGHTFGHALEAETGFSDALLHGEGVAAGMALAMRFSAQRGLCRPSDAQRVTAHLATLGLPSGLRGITASGQELVDHMLHDKKMAGGSLPFILSRGIGAAFVDKSVELKDVAAFLDGEPR